MSEDTNEQNKPGPEGEQTVGRRLSPNWDGQVVHPPGITFNPDQWPPH